MIRFLPSSTKEHVWNQPVHNSEKTSQDQILFFTPRKKKNHPANCQNPVSIPFKGTWHQPASDWRSSCDSPEINWREIKHLEIKQGKYIFYFLQETYEKFDRLDDNDWIPLSNGKPTARETRTRAVCKPLNQVLNTWGLDKDWPLKV